MKRTLSITFLVVTLISLVPVSSWAQRGRTFSGDKEALIQLSSDLAACEKALRPIIDAARRDDRDLLRREDHGWSTGWRVAPKYVDALIGPARRVIKDYGLQKRDDMNLPEVTNALRTLAFKTLKLDYGQETESVRQKSMKKVLDLSVSTMLFCRENSKTALRDSTKFSYGVLTSEERQSLFKDYVAFQDDLTKIKEALETGEGTEEFTARRRDGNYGFTQKQANIFATRFERVWKLVQIVGEEGGRNAYDDVYSLSGLSSENAPRRYAFYDRLEKYYLWRNLEVLEAEIAELQSYMTAEELWQVQPSPQKSVVQQSSLQAVAVSGTKGSELNLLSVSW